MYINSSINQIIRASIRSPLVCAPLIVPAAYLHEVIGSPSVNWNDIDIFDLTIWLTVISPLICAFSSIIIFSYGQIVFKVLNSLGRASLFTLTMFGSLPFSYMLFQSGGLAIGLGVMAYGGVNAAVFWKYISANVGGDDPILKWLNRLVLLGLCWMLIPILIIGAKGIVKGFSI